MINQSTPRRSALSKWAKDEHKRVARTIGYVLTLGSQEAWSGLVTVLAARLSIEERACLAFMALKAMDPDTATKTAKAALSLCAGTPKPPLISIADQAKFWVSIADPEEIDTYCLAAYRAMPVKRQAAFLQYVQVPGVA